MPDNLPPSLIKFREEFSEFLINNRSLSDEELRKLSLQRGYYRMSQPVGLGGQAFSPMQMLIARETVSEMGVLSPNVVIGPEPGLLSEVEGFLKDDYLIPLLKGEKRGSFAFTESKADSPTVAEWDDESLVVSGRKSYVSGGHLSDFMSVVLTVDPKKVTGKYGPAVLVIDSDAPGVEMGEPFYSLDGSSHVEVEFESVRVDSKNVIGEIGQGIPRALGNIMQERIEQAATAVGLALYALDLVTSHLKKPHRSGGTLSDFEGVRLRYADMRINSFAARSVLYRVGRLLESDDNVINEVTTAKIFCTETASSVIDTAVQLVGGQALISGHPLEGIYRKIRSMRIAGGASDVLRLNLSKGVFEFDSGTV
tara:strand:- start:11936 stop:13036 length:1101 start_codon:yes stop_codon:yes gene_type:complete